ncbi:neuraminidase-like domain-containing protein [Pedobacter sp. NJ-S-72]
MSYATDPGILLQFIKQAIAFRSYPQKPADLLFMLKHEATDLVNRELKEDRIIEVLTQLQKDLKKVLTDNQSLYNDGLETDEQREALQNQLAKLANVEPDTVKTLMGFLDATWVTPAAAKTFADDHLAYLDKTTDTKREGFDTTNIKAKIDDLAAATPVTFATVQKTLLKSFFDTISVYFIADGKTTTLVQCLMQTFKAPDDLANVILKYALLRQPAPGTAVIKDLLSSDTFINLIAPITSLNCVPQFSALRLLHKMIPLVNSFQLEVTDTAWYFKNAADLGWFVFDGIPYNTTLNPVNLSLYADFIGIVNLAKSLSPVPDPADVENPLSFQRTMELLLPGNTTSQTTWFETMSLLTGYQTSDLTAIDASLFTVFNLDNYKSSQNWLQVITNAEYLRTLGTTVSQVMAFIKPVLTDTDTTQLRMALKARYDENTWSDTLKEITDAIRPQKRDALIAYLLAVNPDLKDENDLYDYFLVDVEMESILSLLPELCWHIIPYSFLYSVV